MATAGGTLVLAVATFSSIRTSNRSARLAERALLAGLRPLLVPSREDDLTERVRFGDGVILEVPGHGGALEPQKGNLYMALALRNGGSGLAVIHGWVARTGERSGTPIRPELSEFHRQQRDLYIPAGETGFWQGAIRDREDPAYAGLAEADAHGERVMVDLLYGDHEGGQRTITRFGISSSQDPNGPRAEVLRYWNVDGAAPR
ncbi:MAG: hypothetical protein M3Z06_07965 [Actinomycetota bacterium]|nr:hypothetical protein [Actinomycetota bacterium]